MPKYLLQATYSADGIEGLLKEGGTGRRARVKKAIKSLGGAVESFYFAFGDADAIVIASLPDNASAAALALAVGASGLVGIRTTVLLTPEEVDEAASKSAAYSAPGQ